MRPNAADKNTMINDSLLRTLKIPLALPDYGNWPVVHRYLKARWQVCQPSSAFGQTCEFPIGR